MNKFEKFLKRLISLAFAALAFFTSGAGCLQLMEDYNIMSGSTRIFLAFIFALFVAAFSGSGCLDMIERTSNKDKKQ